MKTIPLILSLAMGVTAALEEDSAAAAAANGGIRATKVVTDRTKRDAAAAGAGGPGLLACPLIICPVRGSSILRPTE